MTKLIGQFIRYGLFAALACASSNILADSSNGAPSLQQSQQTQVLGQTMGANVQSGIISGTRQVQTSIETVVLGAAVEALMASMNPPNTIDGVTYTEVYSFGKRIFSDSSYIKGASNGAIDVGLTPTEVRVPVVVYPVGPFTLEVDGGVRFQADVHIQDETVISVVPVGITSIGLQLQANASGAGYIEGYAQFLFLRGGVGGQLDLIDLQSSLNAQTYFDATPPYANVSAMVQFLKGRLYAFLDIFDIWSMGWKRLLDDNLYQWNGFCFSTGAIACPSS